MRMLSGVVERCQQKTQLERIKPLGFDIPHLSHVDLSQAKTFKEIFLEDSYFFYKIEKRNINTHELLLYECGIANFDGDICRILPTSFGLSHPKVAHKMINFETELNEYLTIYSIVPESYIEALCLPNSVLVTGDTIQIITLPEYSILGRKDKNIEAITFEELFNEYTRRND